MKPVKQANGLYRMREQKNGKRKPFYGKTAKECKAKYDMWNGIAGSGPVTFSIAFDAWMEIYVSKQAQATYDQYEALAKQYITPVIGTIKIDRIVPANCQMVLDAAKKKNGMTPAESTLGHIRKVMHGLFEYEVVMKKRIKSNPCCYLSIPKTQATRDRRAATPAELDRIWVAAKKSHYFYCYQFLLLSGFRPSEVCGLKMPKDTDKKIAVSEARTRSDVSSGKTRSAKRTTEITPAMREIIKRQKEYLKGKEISSIYLFPQRDGTPCNSGYLTRNWQRVRSKAKVKVTLYELRHTFVSLTIDKLPMKDLQQQIGHSSKMDTTGTYGHIFRNKDKQNSGIIDDAVSKYLPKSNVV